MNEIQRFSTPTLKFNFTFLTEQLTDIYITLLQGDVIIEKKYQDIVKQDKSVSVKLSQEETGQFKANQYVYIQVRFKHQEMSSFASKLFKRNVTNVLKEGAI